MKGVFDIISLGETREKRNMTVLWHTTMLQGTAKGGARINTIIEVGINTERLELRISPCDMYYLSFVSSGTLKRCYRIQIPANSNIYTRI